MPIISVEIMKITDEREMQKKEQRQKRTRGTEDVVKEWTLNDFVVHFS